MDLVDRFLADRFLERDLDLVDRVLVDDFLVDRFFERDFDFVDRFFDFGDRFFDFKSISSSSFSSFSDSYFVSSLVSSLVPLKDFGCFLDIFFGDFETFLVSFSFTKFAKILHINFLSDSDKLDIISFNFNIT